MSGAELWATGKPVCGQRANDRAHGCPTAMAAVSWCRDDDGDGDDDDVATVPMSGWTEWTVWTVWTRGRAVAAATWSADLEM